MRFIHTSDWHIGRQLHERSLLEDQEYILERFLQLVKDSEVDLVIIAGDIYDRQIPPKEGIRLLDAVITEIVIGLGVPVFMITGNHDSSDRLGFASRLLTSSRLRIVSSPEAMLEPLVLEDRYGLVKFFGIPYFDPPQVRLAARREGIQDHSSAMEWCIQQIQGVIDQGSSSSHQPAQVAVAHGYVAGGSLEESQSERPLSIGGGFAIDPSLFKAFHYTALGHLHRAQYAGSPRSRYSGSILPYGFDEAKSKKSISIVELNEARHPVIEPIELAPLRKLRSLQGDFGDLLKLAERDPSPKDYIEVRREDSLPILDPMGKMRRYYPNILHIEKIRGLGFSNSSSKMGEGEKFPSRREGFQGNLDPGLVFQKFFSEVEGQPLSEDQKTILRTSMEAIL